MGKVEEKKHHKEQKLLNAAFYLFTRKGIAKTTVSDIAQKADVAKGTFYLYFRDKYELQEKLIIFKTEQLFRHALSCPVCKNKETFADTLIAVIDDVISQMGKDPSLLKFINKNLSWGIFRKALTKPNTAFLDAYNRMLAVGSVQYREPEIMLYMIVELVSAACYSVILEQNPTDLEHFKPYLYDSVRAIISSFAAEP